MKILVVDDSNAIRTKLARFLQELGHTVVGEASNGLEAIEQFKKLNPELVTMDIVMPECDGVTALSEILKINSQAKVILITSAATAANKNSALEKGALGFVAKPFVKEKVEQALASIERTHLGKAA